jgi:putative hydrolase of the HAD superfamily
VNIVFDLGGVLVAYDRTGLLERVFPDPAARAIAHAGIVDHAYWRDIDRGILLQPEAVARAQKRTGLPEEDLTRLFDGIHRRWVPQPATIDLLYRLKSRGLRLFCLSNMGVESTAYLEATQTFFEAFEGVVISCRVGYCKPEPEIYRHLLDTYGLEGPRTIFIDDLDENLAAATTFGIHPIRFESAEQCARTLRACGCL